MFDTKQKMWEGLSLGMAALAGLGAMQALRWGWMASKGVDPPEHPEADDVTWQEAIVWTVASGVTIGVARLLAQRGATAAWRLAMDEDPPGLG